MAGSPNSLGPISVIALDGKGHYSSYFRPQADDAAFGIVARRARNEVIDLGRDVVRYGLEQSDARPKVSLSNMTLMCWGLRPIAVPPPKARYVKTRGKTPSRKAD
jgi:hypothetical protein